MSKSSRRPNREAIKAQRKDKKRAEKLLRQRQKAQGLQVSSGFSASNCKSKHKTVEEEIEARHEVVTPIKQLSYILTVFSMGWCFRFCTTSIFTAFTMGYEYQLICDGTQINGIVSLFVRFSAPRFFGPRARQKNKHQ